MTGLLNVAVLVPPLVAGIVVGYYLRSKKLFNAGKLVLCLILILIFSGFSIGSNTELLTVMPHITFNALVLLVTTLLFSILLVKVARKLVKI